MGAARKAAVGVAAGVVLVVLAETMRPRGGRAHLIDWDEISTLAVGRVQGSRLSPRPRARLEASYRRMAAEVTPALLESVGGLPAGLRMPDFQALDRFSWLELNIGLMRRALEPLEKSTVVANSLLAQVGRVGLSRYVALLLGFLSGRVLGQFDPQLLGREPLEHALYLVEPNVARWQEQEDLPGDDLRRWLILHELTHAWQFAAHPWLREHLNEELGRLVALAAGAREGDGRQNSVSSLLALTVGVPSQLAAVRRMQATMSLVEGYGNLVMNLVGRRLLPGYGQLEAAYTRRSRQRSALEVLLWRLTGLELKLQQYRLGEAFSRTIYESHGMTVLNRAWESQDTLPRPEELRHPDRWHRRVVLGQDPHSQWAPATA